MIPALLSPWCETEKIQKVAIKGNQGLYDLIPARGSFSDYIRYVQTEKSRSGAKIIARPGPDPDHRNRTGPGLRSAHSMVCNTILVAKAACAQKRDENPF